MKLCRLESELIRLDAVLTNFSRKRYLAGLRDKINVVPLLVTGAYLDARIGRT